MSPLPDTSSVVVCDTGTDAATVAVSEDGSMGPRIRALHSSTFRAHRKHFLRDTLVDVGLSVKKTAQAGLKGGRV